MNDRNPSPPSDYQDGGDIDKIGDTAYSRKWMYSLLMNFLQFANKYIDLNNEQEITDLDENLEEQLCSLWDLTVNKDVLEHLDEFQIIPIFSSALAQNVHPRFLEITLGILANIACDNTACKRMVETENFIDAPTLTEVCRLIRAVLASDDFKLPWIDEIRFQPDFFDNLMFILKSSTNANLLIGALRVMDVITREDDSLAEIWCGTQLLEAILVAQHEMKWLYGSEVEVIHRLLYTFSSNMNGVSALIEGFPNLLPTLGIYLRKVCEDETHIIHFSKCYNCLRAIIPVIDVVVASIPHSDILTYFEPDLSVIPCLIYIAMACQVQLNEFPLVRGILADLNICFKDLIKAINNTINEMDDSSFDTLVSTKNSLKWIVDLESADKSKSREAFVNCALNDGAMEIRAGLINLCHRMKLEKILELITDI